MQEENTKKTYTDVMFNTSAPYDNPYQGQDRRVLFVCSAGILRSATAARIYAKKYNARAAGSCSYALIPVTKELLLWAKQVVFVNEENYQDVAKNFDLDTFPCYIKVLNIPDNYEHMHPELIQHFIEQYEPLE